MALSTVQTNNKLIKFTQQLNREWVRENLFSPYMGEDLTAIIRRRMELKAGGEQINFPIVARLKATPISTGTLVGAEESIDDYGMRVWLEWARNAVVTKKSEIQKDSADVFGQAKPLLSDWINELTRDEIIAAFMALLWLKPFAARTIAHNEALAAQVSAQAARGGQVQPAA